MVFLVRCTIHSFGPNELSKLVALFNKSRSCQYLATCSENIIKDHGLKAKSMGSIEVKFKNEGDSISAHMMHLYQKKGDIDDPTDVVDDSIALAPPTIEQIEIEIKRLEEKLVHSGDRLGTRGTSTCMTGKASIVGNKRMAESDVVNTRPLGDDVVKRFRFAAARASFKLDDLSKLSPNDVVDFFDLFEQHNPKRKPSLLEYSGGNDSNSAMSAGVCHCIFKTVPYSFDEFILSN